MDEQHDDAQVAMIVATVWGELGPAAERYLAPGTRTSHRRRRQRRAVGVGLVVAVVGTAGAVAARAALGDPAPPPLQASMAAIDEGMPDDLRLNPDVSNARSVARDGDAVMYAADLPDGGVCTEIAVGGKPAGAICRSGNEAPQPIEASIPGTPEDPASTPVVVGGRVAADADRVVVVVGEEVRIPVVLAPGGFFVVALDEVESTAGRQRMLIEASKGSDLVASIDVSDAFTPESGTLDPIAAELISGDGDLSRVVSIYGTVQVGESNHDPPRLSRRLVGGGGRRP